MNDLLVKIFSFNKKPAKLPEYILVERQINPELIVTGVRITGGPLSGMVFTTSPSVSFQEDSNGEVKLKYEYVVQIPPKNQVFSNNVELIEKTVGDIILDIIEKNYNNADRKPDSECLSEGPGVC